MIAPLRRLGFRASGIRSLAVLIIVTLAVAALLGMLSRSQGQTVPEPPPTVVAQVLPTGEAVANSTPQRLLPSETIRSVLIEPLGTPTPEPTPVEPTLEPTEEPTPVPVAEPSPSPTVAPPPLPTATSATNAANAASAPTARASRDPNLLPNGVRYGERKPNLPNRIVRIASPDIKLDTSVYEVYAPKGVWEVADYAGGHHFDSKNPGEGGNIVVSGHNNWRGEVFRYLELLQPGNTINVWTLDGKKYTYRVQELKKLKEAGVPMAQRLENAKVMNPTPSEQLTLITCWPYKTFTHRIIVIAVPVE